MKSPTFFTEAVFLTALIESYEERDVVFFGIPGAYLHTETYEGVIMVLEEPLVELMVKVDP